MKMKNCLHNSYLLWSIIGLLGLMACENPNQTTTNASKTYFDLKGFMKGQITLLNKLQPKVKKEVLSEGKPDSKVVRIKNWEKELKMFSNADINKTSFIGTYDIKNITDAGKQLVVYTSKKTKNSVKQMTVELDASKKNAKSITITIGNNNVLFASGTKLHLNSKKIAEGKYQLSNYQIEGFQKIILRQKRPYAIKATIL